MVKYLAKKGFEIRRGRGSHMFARRGELTTTIPLVSELAPGTLRAILNQVGISREEFLEDMR
jgi:predicted RNA binding protein YcfA (HicA-like mRNA interferase family)